jgi:hypothetical protein
VALAECAWQTSRHTASQRMLRRSMLSGVDDGGEARMSMPAQEVKSAASGSASLRGNSSTLRRALSASRSARRPRGARRGRCRRDGALRRGGAYMTLNE